MVDIQPSGKGFLQYDALTQKDNKGNIATDFRVQVDADNSQLKEYILKDAAKIPTILSSYKR